DPGGRGGPDGAIRPQLQGNRSAPGIGERVDPVRVSRAPLRRRPAAPKAHGFVGDRAGDRNLADAVLGERDADRVAEPVEEERADSDRPLYPAVLAVAGF